MNTMTVQDHTKQVASALVAISGTSKWGSLQAFIRKETKGKTLTDYLNGDATDEVKHKLLDEVEDIVKNNRWDLCPPAPGGQADATATTPAPVAAPKPVTPLAPPLPPAAYTPAPTPPAVIQHVHVGDKVAPLAPVPAPVNPADPFAAMAAAILPHILPHIPATEGGVTKDEVRQMIREELAIVFAAIGKGVAK